MSTLEDNYEDILQKAAHGLGLSTRHVSERSGIDQATIDATFAGHRSDPKILKQLADILDLDGDRLLAIATNQYVPHVTLPHNAWRVETNYSFMRVNAYLAADQNRQSCVIFDAGADSAPMIECIQQHDLHPSHLFLTHTHPDHVAAIPGFTDHFPDVAILSSRLEPWKSGDFFDPGETFTIGSLKIETRLTAGHSPGGTSYVVTGLDTPFAAVGDALFAGSIGGPKISYNNARDHIRREILSLPDETILGPGHGPLTTVALEKTHNPFFA